MNYKILDWYTNTIKLSDKIIFVEYNQKAQADLTFYGIKRNLFSKSYYTQILDNNWNDN